MAGSIPSELKYVYLAISPIGIGGGGGGVWDPQTVREWSEQVAADVQMVMDTLAMNARAAAPRRGTAR